MSNELLIQGSEEWLQARCGKVTASRIADLMAKLRDGKPGASYHNYMAELIAERLTRAPKEHYTNAAMMWGTATEPEARSAYSFFTDLDVVEVGFIDHPSVLMSGASPDGLVGKVGLVEIKCPNTATHIDTLLSQKIPDKYFKQMQWQMACTSRTWCDFVSFDPRMPERLKLFIKRVDRDQEFINKVETEVTEFDTVINEKIEELEKL
jgi:putative phage-type endonuclease